MGRYADVYFSPDRGTADVIIGFIDRCEVEINAAIYALTHDGIAEALIRAHQRGVRVRVLTDNLMASNQYADDEKLEAAGVQVLRDKSSAAMHQKFMTSDGSAVGTGSFNWTKNADERNSENWTVIRLKYLVEAFNKEFEYLWELNSAE